MSNLSDLLPAGAGAKSATFTASGTLATGTTVVLNTDGTVSAVAESAASVGTQTTFESANLSWIYSTYDTTNDKIVIVYTDNGNSLYGTAVVGTVSGASISFGTPVVFASATTVYSTTTFDSNAGKVVVNYADYGNSDYGTAIVGTVSGTTISFGTEVVYNSGATYDQDIAYDSTNNKVVIVYRDSAAGNYGNGIVGTVSGTSISFGSEATFNSGNTTRPRIAYDSVNQKMVVVYADSSAGGYGKASVGTVSGTSISWGSEVDFKASAINGAYNTIVYDSTAQKMIIGYRSNTNLYGTAVVGTVSGTSMTFGSEQAYTSTSAVTVSRWMLYDPTINKTIVAYADSNENKSYVQELTVSGDTITGSTPLRFNTGTGTNATYISLALDSDNNKTIISCKDDGNTDYGVSIVYTPLSTNSANFVGITDEAIANAATGSVVVEGGVITNSSLIDFAFSNGSSSVFESAAIIAPSITFDTSNQKVVIAYTDQGNGNYGTAIVGTVSGESITFGTPTVFASVVANYSKLAFDSTANKVVINYIDATAGDYGKAIVGTVSGTSISFGSATTYNAVAGSSYTAIVYDSGNNKFVVKCAESSARYNVGTVSGTSISFGSQTSLAMQYDGSLVYDSVNGKVVSVYRDVGPNDYGKARVGTVSGTSISFGTDVTFDSTAVDYVSAVYDTDKQKVVVAYHDVTAGDYGKGVVGTVSGTSISFGTPATFNAAGTDYINTVYDSNINKPVVLYQDTGNSSYGTIVGATVSGTDITFSGEYVFLQSTANRLSAGYDSTNNKIITAYRDSGGSNYGTSVVISATDSLTTGSTYYVQNDGSLSTTSSSVTAGKALSSTTLLLKG